MGGLPPVGRGLAIEPSNVNWLGRLIRPDFRETTVLFRDADRQSRYDRGSQSVKLAAMTQFSIYCFNIDDSIVAGHDVDATDLRDALQFALVAHSADPDQPFRPIVITNSGDPDHAVHLA